MKPSTAVKKLISDIAFAGSLKGNTLAPSLAQMQGNPTGALRAALAFRRSVASTRGSLRRTKMLLTLTASFLASILSSTIYADAGEIKRLEVHMQEVDANFAKSETSLIWPERTEELKSYVKANNNGFLLFTTAFDTTNGKYVFSAPLVNCYFVSGVDNTQFCKLRIAHIVDNHVVDAKTLEDFAVLTSFGPEGYADSWNSQTEFFTSIDFDPSTQKLAVSLTEKGNASAYEQY